jgi:hypothetical protein
MAKTGLDVINSALKDIGEPEVPSLTSTNILHQILLEEVNNQVTELMARKQRYAWGLQRGTFLTTAEITTGTVSVTNGDATVTSTDDDGNDADNFGSVTTDMFFRKQTDNDSYKVSSIDTGSSPDTVELEETYTGTTSTQSEFRFFQEGYALTAAKFPNLSEVIIVQYGEGRQYLGSLDGSLGSTTLDNVDFDTIMAISGGDRHRDTSGKPSAFARFGVDSNDDPVYILWPYPTQVYLMEVFYTQTYTDVTGAGTNLFGGDAPKIAYDIVEAGVCERARLYDEDLNGVQYWANVRENKSKDLLQRENRANQADNGMQIDPNRS